MRSTRKFFIVALLALFFSSSTLAVSPEFTSICPSPRGGTENLPPGVSQMLPGRYYNPQRSGQGWDFFWYGNSLETDSSADNDKLFVTFYTYEYNYPIGWVPVWYGATYDPNQPGSGLGFVIENVGGQTYRTAWNGVLYRYNQQTFTGHGPIRGSDAGSGLPANQVAEQVGKVTVYFGSQGLGITPGNRPAEAAVRWTLYPSESLRPHAPTTPIDDCLTNVLNGNQTSPSDNAGFVGVWAHENSASGWFWTPIFWKFGSVEHEHHLLAYFDSDGRPNWLIAGDHPRACFEGTPPNHTPYPATASDANFPDAVKSVCAMRSTGYAPWKYLCEPGEPPGDCAQWSAADYQVRVGKLMRGSFTPAPNGLNRTKVLVVPELGTQHPDNTVANDTSPLTPAGTEDSPFLSVTTLTQLTGLTRIRVDDAFAQGDSVCTVVTSMIPARKPGVCNLSVHFMTEGAHPGMVIVRRRVTSVGQPDDIRVTVSGQMRSPVDGMKFPADFSAPGHDEALIIGDRFTFEAFSSAAIAAQIPTPDPLFKTEEFLVKRSSQHCSSGGSDDLMQNPTLQVLPLDASGQPFQVTAPAEVGGRRIYGIRLRLHRIDNGVLFAERLLTLDTAQANHTLHVTGLVPGQRYSVKAEVFNHCSVRTTASVQVLPPVVTLNYPGGDLSLNAGAPVTLSAQVTDDGTVNTGSVRFVVVSNGIPQEIVATGNGNTYTAAWTPLSGVYTVSAKASDTLGLVGVSSPPRTVTVAAPSEVPNQTVVSLDGELPPHNPGVGAIAAEAGVSGGSSSYRIPVVLPPGRRGMTPDLSLVYSSNSGAGIAGMGWSIGGLSSVSRCPKTVEQDGIRGEVGFVGSDRLCLDGQRLVLVGATESDGAYWATGAEFRTELESFSRVTRQGSSGASALDISFTVQLRNGDIITYGWPVNLNGASGQQSLSWMITTRKDSTGNRIDYHYSNSNGESLLDYIAYTGFDQTEGTRRVKFNYVDRCVNGICDFASTYLKGNGQQRRKLLRSIRTCVSGTCSGPTSTAGTVREYTLSHSVSPSTRRMLLDAVQECAYDGAQSACKGATQFASTQDPTRFALTQLSLPALDGPPSNSPPAGERAPEEVLFGWSGEVVERYQGMLRAGVPLDRIIRLHPEVANEIIVSSDPLEGAASMGQELVRSIRPRGDFDGDGHKEVLLMTEQRQGTTMVGRRYLARVNAVGAVTHRILMDGTSLPDDICHDDATSGRQIFFTPDIDNDGRSDGIGSWPMAGGGNEIVFYSWRGGEFIASQFDRIHTGIALAGFSNACDTFVADIDNDGRLDLIREHTVTTSIPDGVSGTTQIVYHRNTGTTLAPAFAATGVALASFPYTSTAPPSQGHLFEFFSISGLRDVDSDGFVDIVVRRSTQSIDEMHTHFLKNSGSAAGAATATPYSLASLGYGSDDTPNKTYHFDVDINGDGLDDYLFLPSRASTKPRFWHYQLNSGTGYRPAVSLGGKQGVFDPDWGVVSPPIVLFTPSTANAISVVDYDGDSRPDLRVPTSQIPIANYCVLARPNAGGPTLPPLEEFCAYGSTNLLSQLGLQSVDRSIVPSTTYRFVLGANDNYTLEAIDGSSDVPVQRNQEAVDVAGDGLGDYLFNVATESTPQLGDFFVWLDPDYMQPNGVYMHVNRGASATGFFNFPDLVLGVTDGLGRYHAWQYRPLSSDAGRTAAELPLYRVPARDATNNYVSSDPRHFYFNSSMPVVSEMYSSNGIYGVNGEHGMNRIRYGYSEAIFNKLGRGFQGFRSIVEEEAVPDDGANDKRTVTYFHQKFPLAGRMEEQRLTRKVPFTGNASEWDAVLDQQVLSRTSYTWRCRPRSGAGSYDAAQESACQAPTQGTHPILLALLYREDSHQYDPGSHQPVAFSATVNAVDTLSACIGAASTPSFATVSSFDGHGNALSTVSLTEDRNGGGSAPGFEIFTERQIGCVTRSYVADAGGSWWLDRLSSETRVNKVRYSAGHALPPSVGSPPQQTTRGYTWRNDRTLQQEVFQSGQANQQIQTVYGQYAYGMPGQITVTGSGDQNISRSTLIGYSSDGYFASSTTNPLGQVSGGTTRPRDGAVERSVDPNGIETLTSFDVFGTPITVRTNGANGQRLMPDRKTSVQVSALLGTAYVVTSVQNGQPTTASIYDMLGRLAIAETRLADETVSFTAVGYNARGQKISETAPSRYGVWPSITTITDSYDILGRLLRRVDPALAGQSAATRTTEYTYHGRQVNIAAWQGAPSGTCTAGTAGCLQMSRTADAQGRIVRTIDALGGQTHFWFDANGSALAIRDPMNAVTHAAYNAAGHRTSVVDPNRGSWSYGYNALGELLTQTDARGIVTTSVYDRLGRKTERTASVDIDGVAGNEAVRDLFAYDAPNAIGALLQTRRTVNNIIEREENFTYDAFARLTQTQTIQNTDTAGGYTPEAYVTRQYYDANYGRIKQQTYPTGDSVWLRYGKYGHLVEQKAASGAPSYWVLRNVDARDNVTLEGYDEQTIATATLYDPGTGHLLGRAHGLGFNGNIPATDLRTLNYAYDAFGNVKQQTNDLTYEDFTYDKLHRLTSSARIGAATATVNYSYNAAGNFLSKSDFASSYTYGSGNTAAAGDAGPNAVTGIVLAGGGKSRQYGYDNNGNMISDTANGDTFLAVYDADNLPTRIERGTSNSRIRYAAGNQRTRQWGTDGTRYSIGDYEKVITSSGMEHKVTIGGHWQITHKCTTPVASVANPAQCAAATTTTAHVLLKDRLGSVDTIIDTATNAVVDSRGYDAFGKPRNGDWSDAAPPPRIAALGFAITAKGFTSHEHLNAVQLIHMNGRAYDYQLGRFLAVDPFIQSPLNSQSLNPYSYIMNNPLAGTDPTGYLVEPMTDWQGPNRIGPICMFARHCYGGAHAPSAPYFGSVAAANNGAEGQSSETNNSSTSTAASEIGDSKLTELEVIEVKGMILDDARKFLLPHTYELGKRGSPGNWGDVLSALVKRVEETQRRSRDNMPGIGMLVGAVMQFIEEPIYYTDQELPTVAAIEGAEAAFGVVGGGVIARLGMLRQGTTPVAVTVADGIANAAKGGAGLVDDAAKLPVGRLGNPVQVPGPQNVPTTISGRQFSGHALDQMQGRGLMPSVVENTIQRGATFPTRAGTTGYFDAVNRVRVITDTASGRVVTVIPGAP
jgi:RHS repeat-associated protein